MGDMDDMHDLDLTRPTKRRRMLLVEPPPTSLLYSQHDQFWFLDGDIVLCVEQTYFKIHRNKLLCSIVFAGMLELPQPQVVESVDRCALVTLSGDSVADWTVTLRWMYDRSTFESRPTMFDSFGVIASALRISTKYEISDLCSWSKQQLLSRWPIDLLEMNCAAFLNAAEGITLARELDVPEILPAAFYALSMQRLGRRGDGRNIDHILSPEDLQRLVVGREKLKERPVGILKYCDDMLHDPRNRRCLRCRHLWSEGLASRLLDPPFGRNWLLDELKDFLRNPYVDLPGSLCCDCLLQLECVVATFIKELCRAIPLYFQLCYSL
ncbi:hypothetical protein EV401DRAFT_1610131 [Pisolithus croceorrhizus]|nr:hypothetical protein EV401DRAFT_1610131 [Pisolithus croceorrhizus]